MRKLPCAILLFCLPLIARAQVPNQIAQHLRTFETPHYIFHTDLDDIDAREADLRMSKMFDEYQRRTAGFSGTVTGKFPFYLFKTEEEYYAAGGPPNSGGVFMIDQYGTRLMGIASEENRDYTWHTVQHEGFHQFAHAVIRGELPIWVNEGLAEYFGEAIFTGDSFVSGIIPPPRLEKIKKDIRTKNFKPFATMLALPHEQWNAEMKAANYDQAWAMVHFLANADNGKYQPAFVNFMQQVGRGQNGLQAWYSAFGTDSAAFQTRFEKWWLALPPNPTRNLYAKTTIMIFTSYLSRTWLQHKTFKDMNDFLANFDPKKLPTSRDIWLPAKLYGEVKDVPTTIGKWTLEYPPKQLPRITFLDEDGTKYVGQFTIALGHVDKVWADITPPGATTQPAK